MRSRAASLSENPDVLSWVEMEGAPSIRFGNCDDNPESATYSDIGKTTNRLAGTFSEHGTWTQTSSDGTIAYGPLKTTFTITSGTTIVTGTRTIVVATDCVSPGIGDFSGVGPYTATLKVTVGSGPHATQRSYIDTGLSTIGMDFPRNKPMSRGGFASDDLFPYQRCGSHTCPAIPLR